MVNVDIPVPWSIWGRYWVVRGMIGWNGNIGKRAKADIFGLPLGDIGNVSVGESVDPSRGYNVSSVNQQDVNIRQSDCPRYRHQSTTISRGHSTKSELRWHDRDRSLQILLAVTSSTLFIFMLVKVNVKVDEVLSLGTCSNTDCKAIRGHSVLWSLTVPIGFLRLQTSSMNWIAIDETNDQL